MNAFLLKIDLEIFHGVLFFPCLDFFGSAVFAGVIGRGVVAHPVGEGFDQGRALLLALLSPALFWPPIHGQHIVSVHQNTRESISQGFLCESWKPSACPGQGDGILVIVADEYIGCPYTPAKFRAS